MPTLDEQDIVLLQRLKRHPLLRARVESLLGVVEDAEGDLEKADAAERRVIEELRQMGNDGQRGVDRVGAGRHRQMRGTSAGAAGSPQWR